MTGAAARTPTAAPTTARTTALQAAPAAVLSVTLSVALAACATGPRKEEYVARADAICAEANRRAAAIGEPRNDAELVAALERSLPILRDAERRLRALPQPSKDRKGLTRFVDRLGASVAASEDMLVAARAGNRAALDAAAERSIGLGAEAAAIAEAYGMRDCASPAPRAA